MADVHLTYTDCWCGLPFAMPTRLYNECQKTGQKFYCPLGHCIVFKESEADRYRREAERLKQQLARKDDEIRLQRNLRDVSERRVSAYKGQVTKLKKRASAGVCPCCNRQFQDLHRHMEMKHPGYTETPDAGDNVVPLKAAKA